MHDHDDTSSTACQADLDPDVIFVPVEPLGIEPDPLWDKPLSDKYRSGRERPWKDKKTKSMALADAYAAVGDAKKAKRCRSCGSNLLFVECLDGHAKRLRYANFCGSRLCPMCAWRRSLKLMYHVSRVLHVAVEDNPQLDWAMLTLTVRNTDALGQAIDNIAKAWKRLTERDALRGVVGFFRSIEVTRGRDGLWHPHMHVLLAVRPSYWGKDYIPQAQWRTLWQEALGTDYHPVVEVHKVRRRKKDNPMAEVALEVGKYTVKDSDLLSTVIDNTSLMELDAALKGRRLIAWGGILRKISSAIRKAETDPEDLVHISDIICRSTECPVCGSDMVHAVYEWGANGYRRWDTETSMEFAYRVKHQLEMRRKPKPKANQKTNLDNQQ